MNDKPLSQTEAYKVADWLKGKGKDVEAALKNLWRKRPSDVAKKYGVDQREVAKAADREVG
jgi:hypothetical protein